MTRPIPPRKGGPMAAVKAHPLQGPGGFRPLAATIRQLESGDHAKPPLKGPDGGPHLRCLAEIALD